MRSTLFILIVATTFLFTACVREGQEEVTSTYPSGKKKETAVFQGKDKERIRVRSFEYYESGERKKEFTYRDNLLSGAWTYWYKDGRKFGDGFIENKAINLSMVTGREAYYWPNGVKMLEAQTVGGGLKPGSTAIFRDEAGKEYADKGRPGELVEKSKTLLERWERGEI
jgi:antitoxin component YwqK of YwqJK toxin-antitoxin module